MSKIDDQIKELIKQKKKTELFWHILESLASYKNPDFDEVKEEVVAEVKAFVDAQIAMIEDGKRRQLTGEIHSDDLDFTLEEVKILKQTVRKLLTPKEVPAHDPYASTQPQAPQKQKPVDNRQDKISFALQNRHLANKRVRCQTEHGEVLGTVVGIDAPHIIVKTDTGHTAPMPLETMVVING